MTSPRTLQERLRELKKLHADWHSMCRGKPWDKFIDDDYTRKAQEAVPVLIAALDSQSALLADTKRDFEVARKANHMFEEAANAWMERALSAEALPAEAVTALENVIKCDEELDLHAYDYLHYYDQVRAMIARVDSVLAKIKGAQKSDRAS